MARLSEKHLQEHKLIEDDQLREGGFGQNIGLAPLILWHDQLHGRQVFSDEVIAAYDKASGKQLAEGLRTMRENAARGS